MAHHVFVDHALGLIRADHTGDVDLPDLQLARSEIVAQMEATGLRRLLADYRGVGEVPSLPEIFRFVDEHYRLFPGNSRLAFLVDPQRHGKESALAENVGSHWGMCLKAFHDEQLALAWLDEVPSPPSATV